MQDVMNVNQKEYKIVKLLGHGRMNGIGSYLSDWIIPSYEAALI